MTDITHREKRIKLLDDLDKQYDRIISIGDIHGKADSLFFLIQTLKITDRDFLIFLGDYTDRGTDSFTVIEYLITLKKTYNCIFIRGNHDSMFLDFFKLGGSPGTGQYWLRNGGDTTLEDYKATSTQIKYSNRNIKTNYTRDQILSMIPKAHIEFLKDTAYFIEFDHAFYSHAGFEVNKLIKYDEQNEDCYNWTRENFIAKDSFEMINKHVVHGHTINRVNFRPYYLPEFKQINLDSGCFISNVLSSLVVHPNSKEMYFVITNQKEKFVETEDINGKYTVRY